MHEPLGSRYEHVKTEEKIYRLWEESGYFNPDKLPAFARASAGKPTAKPFTIIMPPPNANGALHVGHAVGVTLEDIMIRFWRMRGRRALWLPGADHAGFETQVVFDKKLEKEGRNRFTIDRETLSKEIWDFTQANKKIMYGQLKKLGASCDWSRETFTLDPKIVKGVYATFKKLYDDGLAYRDLRVVNWCPKHKTALSDLEVKYVEREDPLYYINYGPLTLATVRPETKFGDTALAVNPKDKRYKKYIGKVIEAKGILGPLKFKVIGDEAVDPEFGTGVVKVTPAHDPNDFEIWKRHKDEIPGPKIVIDENGRLTQLTGPYAGLKVEGAREKVVEDMRKAGILEKTDPHYKHQVATCYKCGNTLEPLPRPQWFIKTKPLAKGAIEAAKSGKIKIHPDHQKKVYLNWLQNIRDWNISRQIVWGIRIPAWYCMGEAGYQKMGFEGTVHPQVLRGKTRTYRLRDYGLKIGEKVFCENTQTGEIFGYGAITQIRKTEIHDITLPDEKHGGGYKTTEELILALRQHNPGKVVTPETDAWIYDFDFKIDSSFTGCGSIIISSDTPKKCRECGRANLVQDPDVFDTWFSSGEWPFLTLGYPDHKDYKTFYPTDVMETGYDILFFWVARMVMLSLYRTGKIPFKTVYLHGLVRDKDKQKMSKSKGNVVDPLGVAETYGTDALRMALVVGNTPGNDIVITEEKIRGYRNFATKIWNVSRFILMNKSYAERTRTTSTSSPYSSAFSPHFTIEDRKNLAELQKIKTKVTKHLEKFEFHLAAETVYHYIWHTFADKIIESYKKRLGKEPSGSGAAMRPSGHGVPSLAGRAQDSSPTNPLAGGMSGSQNQKVLDNQLAAYQTLETILLECLKMLHPFMPFVTEEIFQKFRPGKILMVEKW